MNTRALFIVSAVSRVTTSMSFAIRGDVANAMSGDHLANERRGVVFSPAFGIIFVGLWIYYRSGGGYEAVRIGAGH